MNILDVMLEDSSSEVKLAQNILVKLNMLTADQADGTINPATKKALDKYFASPQGKQDRDTSQTTGKTSVGGHVLPVKAPVTQAYGAVSKRGSHPGVDLGSSMGTPVKAPVDGVIVKAGLFGNCGNMVYMKGGDETHKFCHLTQINVKAGQEVSAGDVVALSGGGQSGPGKGLSTGPHLHWEKTVAGRSVNPMAESRYNRQFKIRLMEDGNATVTTAQKILSSMNLIKDTDVDGTLNPATKRALDKLFPGEPNSADDSDTSGATSAKVGKDGSIIIGDQKRSGGTISWRCNNPGNVMYGSFAKSHGALGSAKAGDTEPVAIMPTLDHGIKMQMDLWRRPMYNNLTIDAGCQQWATGVKKQGYGSKYARDLANAAGASLDTKVASLSDDQLKSMVKAQMRWEGFKAGTVTQV
jgi:hypothetical protein